MNSLKLGNIVLTVEIVSPAQALAWQERNGCNRALRQRAAEQYARDMEQKRWHIKPVAICFLANGELGNGQHTLRAIVMSGQAQTLLIARNVPQDCIASMDRGLIRSVVDIAHFLGISVTQRPMAVAKIVQFGLTRNVKRSYEESIEAFMTHKDAVQWTIERAGNAKFISATVLAVASRAWYREDRSRIENFLAILQSGITSDACDNAAILLRDALLTRRSDSAAQTRARYGYCEGALAAFLSRRPLKMLKATDLELFPLPHEPAFTSLSIASATSKGSSDPLAATKQSIERRSGDD